MASAQCSRSIKLETPEMAVKASAAAFFEICAARTYEVANAFPQNVEKVELVEGQWGKPGSVICWHYFVDGNKQLSKEVMDVIDYDKKYASYRQIEGHFVNLYKSFTFHVHATPKSEGSLVRISVEYEKRNETDPDPHSMIDWLVEFTKATDAYLVAKA